MDFSDKEPIYFGLIAMLAFLCVILGIIASGYKGMVSNTESVNARVSISDTTKYVTIERAGERSFIRLFKVEDLEKEDSK
jgi:hypothetical protein